LERTAIPTRRRNHAHGNYVPTADVRHSLRTKREKLMEIGIKVVRQSGHVIFQMAGIAVPLKFFLQILSLIARRCHLAAV
jgi:hypothetical protein